MTCRFGGVLRLLVILLSLAWTGPSPLRAEETPRAETIIVGVVKSDAQKAFPKMEALVNYLAGQLGPVGIKYGGAVVAATNDEMAALLQSGAVDVLSETPFAAVHLENAGAEILLREWKNGVAEYRGLLVVRKDSGIDSLDDLVGRIAAFEDRSSTTGFLLPLAILHQHGIRAVEIPEGDSAPPGAVGYVFASDGINIAAWIVRGLAAVGAVKEQDWDDPLRTPDALKNDLAILFTSEALPRSLFLARASLPENLKQAIKDIMLRAHEDEAGIEALKIYNGVEKYDDVAGPAAERLDYARSLFPLVEKEIH